MSKKLIDKVRKITIRNNISGSEKNTLRQVERVLDRNEPKKPYIHDEYSDPECPNCRKELDNYYSYTLKMVICDNFCKYCGQKLDSGLEDG